LDGCSDECKSTQSRPEECSEGTHGGRYCPRT
jgi:hypothetical protein